MAAEQARKYISLQEASTLCKYSQEYLSLRARSGKLKAKKLGRNWVTTPKWLEEYVKQARIYQQDHRPDKKIPLAVSVALKTQAPVSQIARASLPLITAAQFIPLNLPAVDYQPDPNTNTPTQFRFFGLRELKFSRQRGPLLVALSLLALLFLNIGFTRTQQLVAAFAARSEKLAVQVQTIVRQEPIWFINTLGDVIQQSQELQTVLARTNQALASEVGTLVINLTSNTQQLTRPLANHFQLGLALLTDLTRYQGTKLVQDANLALSPPAYLTQLFLNKEVWQDTTQKFIGYSQFLVAQSQNKLRGLEAARLALLSDSKVKYAAIHFSAKPLIAGVQELAEQVRQYQQQPRLDASATSEFFAVLRKQSLVLFYGAEKQLTALDNWSSDLTTKFSVGVLGKTKQALQELQTIVLAVQQLGRNGVAGMSGRLDNFNIKLGRFYVGLSSVHTNFNQTFYGAALGLKRTAQLIPELVTQTGTMLGRSTELINSALAQVSVRAGAVSRALQRIASTVQLFSVRAEHTLLTFKNQARANFFALISSIKTAFNNLFVSGTRLVFHFFERAGGKELAQEQPESATPFSNEQGIVIVPSTGVPQSDQQLAQRVRDVFSDQVAVKVNDNGTGIITPVFKQRQGEDYLFIMVPLNNTAY